ncbi:hypothetical protein B23_2845 [Geobacillus thermoleovorans B23]|nr:hypothetical protein B23_2845 [Geobacillus thermoleovorans B23]
MSFFYFSLEPLFSFFSVHSFLLCKRKNPCYNALVLSSR